MKNNVIFLGCTNDYGNTFSACNTKVEFMAKGLNEQGDICCIHNGLAGKQGLKQNEYKNFAGIGTVINYVCKGAWYISSFRNYNNLVKDLKRLLQPNMNNWVVLEAPYLPFYYLELLAARKSGYKVVVISHEWLRTMRDKNLLIRWMKYLYSFLFGYTVDAILPISEYIIQRIQKFNKPYLKVPVEADYASIPNLEPRKKYFLYCVTAEYLRVILMVLGGFKEFSKSNPEYKMILVLAGHEHSINAVYKSIKELRLSDSVEIRHKIPYTELVELYRTASALIVPLDPDYKQDEARFSQKIAEYLSSGTAIISNNVGEVRHYFKDKENILLNEYSEQGFCRSFVWVASNPQEAIKIGRNGYKVGQNNFDYRICGKQLHNFLGSI